MEIWRKSAKGFPGQIGEGTTIQGKKGGKNLRRVKRKSGR